MASTTHTAPETHTGVKIPVLEREKLILNGHSYHWITERICGVVENKQPLIWWLLFIPSALIAAIALFAGAFLIFNTLSMTVAERIREVGLLRAMGVDGVFSDYPDRALAFAAGG